MTAFSLHLLGDPVLRGPAGLVTGRAAYRRRIALLSILALARGRPVGRERLIGLLWPESSSDSARHTLSEALYVLRKEIGDGLFVAVGDEVALNREVMDSDAARFEDALDALRPEDAVRVYGGPFLDGFYVADAPEFERWAEGERDRLARAYAQALETLATSAEAAGDPLAAAEWWRRLAAHDPYTSRVALRLVGALDAAGDRVAAFRFASTHAALMREELGADPDPELARLLERLRAEPLRVPARADPPPGPPDAREPADPAGAGPAAAAADGGGEVGTEWGGAAAEAEAGDPAGSAGEEDAAAELRDDEPGAVPAESIGGEPDAGEAAPEGDGFPPAAAAARRRRRLPLVGAAAGLAAALAVAVAVAAMRGGAPADAAPRYDPRRIAVLYLDDYSPGGELGYLANGLTEMLIHQLSNVEALDVVSRNGVKPYRDHPVPFRQMAADLRAGSVVEGSVQRAGDSVRVTIQLIDANTEAHLESRSVVRPLDAGGVFALQERVAEEVAAFLRRRVGREIRLSALRREAGDPRAVELVLRASQARDDAREMARSTDPADVRSALRVLASADSMLARAAAMDPAWTEPPLQRGWAQVERGRLLPGPAAFAAFDVAEAQAELVLRADPASIDARELRGSSLWSRVMGDPGAARGKPWLADAERDLRAVLDADPQRASAWVTLGQLLRLSGNLAEADLAARRGREEDAYLDVPDVGAERLYRAALALGDLPRAHHWCAQGRARFPADYRFRECALVLLARDSTAPPRPDSAWRLVNDINRLDPPAVARAAGRLYNPAFRQMMAAAVLARAGMGDSARTVAGRARAQAAADAGTRVSFLWDDAYLHLLLGDSARSAALLRAFVAARPSLRVYVAREPAFRGVWRP
jgi:DNA-binding SARP family transcriptional activator/TolB-like protein